MILRSYAAASFWAGSGRFRKVAAFLLIFEGFVEIEHTDERYRFILDHRIEVESVQQTKEQHRDDGGYKRHF